MATIGNVANNRHNRSRMEMIQRTGKTLNSAQAGDPYTGQLQDIYTRGRDLAQKTGVSPLQVDDVKRLNEAAYIRDANLFKYDPKAFELQGINRKLQNQISVQGPAEFRNRQVGLANLLTQRAMGTAPSVAQMQLQQGADQSQKALLSALASQRGGQSNTRALARAGTESAMGVNQQASLLRAQEMQSAEQNLSGLLQSARGVDSQEALANQQAVLNAMRFNQAGRSQLEQQRGSDLLQLQQINETAGVQTRKKKPGKLSNILRAGPVVGNITNATTQAGAASAGKA